MRIVNVSLSSNASWVYPKTSVASALESRAAEYTFAMSENWDGRGAKALTADVLKRAVMFLEDFSLSIDPTDITPGRDGSLSFAWEAHSHQMIYCDIGPRDTLHVYLNVLGAAEWEKVSTVSDKLLCQAFNHAIRKTFAASSASYFKGYLTSSFKMATSALPELVMQRARNIVMA